MAQPQAQLFESDKQPRNYNLPATPTPRVTVTLTGSLLDREMEEVLLDAYRRYGFALAEKLRTL